MVSHAWICFDCRHAVRRNPAFTGEVACPTCGKACTYLGYRIPVPAKAKVREWDALKLQLHREHAQRQLEAAASAVRDRHELEQEIARLEAMPANKGRAQAVRLLRKRLGSMT